MNTVHFRCGCSISTAGKDVIEIVGVNVCYKHVKIFKIQSCLQKLATAVESTGELEHDPSEALKRKP